jgi:orotidine-5'-phosphate decarboxylase
MGLDPEPATGTEVAERCRELIELAGDSCIAVKPQLACFERLGAAGREALGETVVAAHDAGLLVIADAKRGDVPHIAEVYGDGLLAKAGLGADALTVNPLMGGDVVDAFVEVAEREGSGLFALVRTSNPGAADILDLDAGGRPVFEHLAELVAARADRLAGSSGLSGMGAVVGATEPRHLAQLRELMPRSVFLLPGVGAQGGDPAQLAAAFGEHPASAIVTASRSIAGADDPAAAAAALRETVWNLSAA